MPSVDMRAEVAKLLGVPPELPLVSPVTYVIHTKADNERECRHFETGWYNDRCQYSFYINKYKRRCNSERYRQIVYIKGWNKI